MSHSDTHVHVSAIYEYPLKSCAPVQLSRAYVDPYGLAGDRRYLVTDPDGNFLTGRKHPRLASLLATHIDGGLAIAAEGESDLILKSADFPDDYVDVQVWRQGIFAQRCGDAADAWMSRYLGTPARVVFFGPLTTRAIRDVQSKEVSFADGYPLLLANEASLDAVQAQCPAPLVMEQFRPNIVISGAEAWAEDGWKQIRIGALEFDIHSPCERCVFTTLTPRTEHFHPMQQPLRTLIKMHSGEHKEPLFGQNVIARGTGVIEVGTAVEILA